MRPASRAARPTPDRVDLPASQGAAEIDARARAPELFASAPEISSMDVLANKL
jgi:hypothetical protein